MRIAEGRLPRQARGVLERTDVPRTEKRRQDRSRGRIRVAGSLRENVFSCPGIPEEQEGIGSLCSVASADSFASH